MSNSDNDDKNGACRANKQDHSVGYGKPPKHTRFKSGQSGNPGGRPKRSRSLGAEFNEILAREISVHEGDQTKKVTIRKAILLSTAKRAMSGDHQARKEIFAAIQQYEHEERTKELGTDRSAQLIAEDRVVIDTFAVRLRQALGNNGT